MESIGQNIKHLRKSKGLTQEELAKKIGVNRAMIGSYEENRAMPKLSALQDIAHYFSISMDDLVNKKLWETSNTEPYETQISKYAKGENLRILSTIVNQENKELITTVPVQAAAGYTQGYADPDYIEELPRFSLPLVELSKEKSYRVFQIKGDSMEPIKSGSYIICEYVANWEDIADGKPYILITKDEGIVYKRIYSKIGAANEILLKSDNPDYEPYTLDIESVFEIWKALGFISFDLPNVDELSLNKLHHMIVELKNEVKSLKSK
ncbi:MAG: LexA family transcriptional regulator [Bacteroidales bacterium]